MIEERPSTTGNLCVLPFALCLFLAVLILASCTATRPVAKIGLAAPFEGLYRQRGYEALAAMRAAIAEAETRDLEVMPLALDLGDEPEQTRRTVAKLLADPALRAVVGPLTPHSAAAVAQQMETRAISWYLPFVPTRTATGFPAETEWAVAFVSAVARAALAQGSTGLALAGWNAGWPAFADADWRRLTGETSVRVIADPLDVIPGEAVLWLGDAAIGADFFVHLRIADPTLPFWLAATTDDSIFQQRALAQIHRLDPNAGLGPLYWATWLDEGFESWQADHQPNSPTAYAVYRATEAALAAITGAPLPSVSWRVHFFRLLEDGSSQPVSFGTW